MPKPFKLTTCSANGSTTTHLTQKIRSKIDLECMQEDNELANCFGNLRFPERHKK